MKSFTSSFESKINTETGTEPMIVVKIDWPTGTKYYGERASRDFILGTLCEVGAVTYNRTADSSSAVATIQISILDYDGDIKTCIDTTNFYNAPCIIYQYYEELGIGASGILFRGAIASDINWDEGTRKFSCTIDSNIKDDNATLELEEDDLVGMTDDAVGKIWPLCFGRPLRVPAAKILAPLISKIESGLAWPLVGETFKLSDGSLFPQEVAMNYRVTETKLQLNCTVDGDNFTVNKILVNYGSVTSQDQTAGFESHETGFRAAARTMEDRYNNSFYFNTEESMNLSGMWLRFKVTTYGSYNKANYRQVQSTSSDGKLHRLVKPSDRCIDHSCWLEICAFPPPSWEEGLKYYEENVYVSYSKIWAPGMYYNYTFPYNFFYDDDADPDDLCFATADFHLTTLDEDIKHTYVVNSIASSSIIEVLGKRSTDAGDEFSAVPTELYEVKNTTINGRYCTVLTITDNNFLLFKTTTIMTSSDDSITATQYAWIDYDWTGDFYVSLNSTVGPNVADILRFIFHAYTNLVVDDTSYNELKTKVDAYPACFAVMESMTAMELADRICLEARCAYSVVSGKVFFKYLSYEPSSIDITLDNDNIIERQFSYGTTDIEGLVTKINATWYEDYSGLDKHKKTFKYTNNTDDYGLHEEDMTIMIYNIESLVQKTVAWLGYRMSNIWRTAQSTTILETLQLDVFDDVTVYYDNSISGEVQNIVHNARECTINYDILLAAKLGTIIDDDGFWHGDDEYPISPEDEAPGLSEPDPSDPVDVPGGPITIIPDIPVSKEAYEDYTTTTTTTSTTEPPIYPDKYYDAGIAVRVESCEAACSTAAGDHLCRLGSTITDWGCFIDYIGYHVCAVYHSGPYDTCEQCVTATPATECYAG